MQEAGAECGIHSALTRKIFQCVVPSSKLSAWLEDLLVCSTAASGQD